MSDSGSQRVFWVGVGLAVLLVVLVLFWPRVAEEFEPRLASARVAIDGGDGVARTGSVTIHTAASARLYAVLEATTRGGSTIYYTEAKRLEVDGVEIPADRLEVWDRPEELTVLWFTVEGSTPYVPIRTLDDLEGLRFEALFHADWPRAWSIPVALTPRHAEHLRRGDDARNRSFGSQRYHVRLERRDPRRPAIVLQRYKSPGPEAVSALGVDFPRVVASLEGALGSASRAFGLTQLEPVTGVDGAVLEGIADLALRELAFSRATVLHDLLADRAPDLEALAWSEVTLADPKLRWGDEVAPGDLVRVGARVSLLFEDRGVEGRLDGEDLCFDFEKGAIVNTLAAVFGEGARVEWSHLPGR